MRDDTYSGRGDRHVGREEENDAHKRRPDNAPPVDEVAGPTKCPWPWLELVEENLAENGNAVAPVQGDGRDIENGANSLVATQSDEVNGDADEGEEPHGRDRSVSPFPDLGPEAGARQHLVTREGPDGAGARL